MHTLSTMPGAPVRPSSAGCGQRRPIAPLAAIVVAHLILFGLLESGMLSKVTQIRPVQVVNVSFVEAVAPQKPAPQPKTVQVAQQMPTFVPPLPQLSIPQIEPTITVPPPQAHPAEAVAAAAPAPAAPPPPVAPAVPKTVTGVEYIRAPQAVYPATSRRMGETGRVVLRVLIGAQGLPEQAIVQQSSGSGNLDEAGRQAALRALYKPYLEDGKAVPVYVLVPINFQLS